MQTKEIIYSAKDYQELELSRSCLKHENICRNLDLKEEFGEGVAALNNKEYFIYLNTQRRAAANKFLNYTQVMDAETLLAISLLFESSFFQKFANKEIDQIHLILKDSSLINYKVIRLSSHSFRVNAPERAKLQGAMKEILQGANVQVFWDIAHPLMKIQLL
jgi:hypothetical protein